MGESNEEILDKLEEIEKHMEEGNKETLDKLENIKRQIGQLSSNSDIAFSFGLVFGGVAVSALGVTLVAISEVNNGLILECVGLGLLLLGVFSFRYPFWRR